MSGEPLWKGGSFLIAMLDAPEKVKGWTYRGLGMWKVMSGSPKGRRPPFWSLTHLGTGHRVCALQAHMVDAFAIATEIAEITDWEFLSLGGWRDRDPELPSKIMDFAGRYPGAVLLGDRVGGPPHQNHDVARRIAEERA